ncbi:hypothetical protein COO60DRAFT_1640999 [Scenedesmus sp. NREL 46B-D3]|nr:hypothetical protein COO60DRAFT_1640999 [Scenedesmus sp. NREL 46B-D3]
MGKPGASVKKHAVAFLDPRSSARIMVTDPCGGSEHVSCFDYNAMKFPGIEAELVRDAAGQPLLPCIGVRLSAGKAAAGSGTGSLEDGFLSYPVEVCWLEQGKVKKRPGGWPPEAAGPTGPGNTHQVPPWIEAELTSSGSGNGMKGAACFQSAAASAIQLQLPQVLQPTAQAAASPAAAAAAALHHGFRCFIGTLLPTRQEKAVMRRTLDAVCRTCEQIRLTSPDTGMRWNVASVIKAGSFEKATGLRRRELLAAVEQQLCSEASADAAASPAAGWRLKSCHSEHFLRLQHTHLQLQMDVQAAGAAADDAKGPPNYIWEVFVLYVLEQRTQQRRLYEQQRPLELFMDVLLAASQLLRCTPPPSTDQQAPDAQQQQQQLQCEPIILEVYYSKQQALLPSFSRLWGSGRLYRPAIINPVDPSYNCTAWQPFRQWDELAAAAGDLACAAAGELGGTGRGWRGWRRDSSCTLGAAVEAFKQ